TSIDSDMPRTATASALSAPATRAALTSRSARSVRAVWSNKDEAGACIGGSQMGLKPALFNRHCKHFVQARQGLVNHGSQRLVNHAAQSTPAPEMINREH